MVPFVRLVILLVVIDTCTSSNCTDSSLEAHSRSKRWLSFYPYGGVAKLIMGCVLPVRFHHKLKRSCNMALNVQANYAIPTNIIWPLPQSYFKNRFNNDYVDTSRGQLYQLLEKMIGNFGSNGRECMLRAICEVAETPLGHNGMLGEVLDVVFTPYDTDQIDEVYKQAKQNGYSGSDCVQLYKDCPVGHGVLEKMTFLHLI